MAQLLDATKLSAALAASGLSQADLAKQLDVSRTAVSKWFRGESFPRPDKLLKMALTVDLPYEELICEDAGTEPVVAFRKKGSRKTKQKDVDRAKDMGRLIRL
jgi:transcriptional regulator with XRE-family HTH domain